MRIWKWELEVTDRQVLQMPYGAQILSVQMQGDVCCLWAMCIEDAPLTPRYIDIYGTGNAMSDAPGVYISTFQMAGGSLVFHAFEAMP